MVDDSVRQVITRKKRGEKESLSFVLYQLQMVWYVANITYRIKPQSGRCPVFLHFVSVAPFFYFFCIFEFDHLFQVLLLRQPATTAVSRCLCFNREQTNWIVVLDLLFRLCFSFCCSVLPGRPVEVCCLVPQKKIRRKEVSNQLCACF